MYVIIMNCKHNTERYYIYDCDGFICETCKKEVSWVERDKIESKI